MNFFQECDKADKISNGLVVDDSPSKKRSRAVNPQPTTETKSMESLNGFMKDKGMLGFDNKVKNDVMQTLGILCKNSEALSQWTENPDKFNSAQFSKDNNYQTGMASKYTNQLEIDNSLRRENSASNVVGALTESIWKKQSHPLSKVSLLNKTYFMILLISRKVTPDNILKVIQYFQNYYPQNYDTNCSI